MNGTVAEHKPTITELIGRGCGVLLHPIVRVLAISKISPNQLTFIGLLIVAIVANLLALWLQQEQRFQLPWPTLHSMRAHLP